MARRRAPIRIGNMTQGAAISSQDYMGSVVGTLTDTLRRMQLFESLKNMGDGDPETFLAFAEPMLKKIGKDDQMSPLITRYIAEAKNKLVELKSDAAAYTQYARTNNHQAMLDYLVEKANKTTDPATLTKLWTQINELRTRVFKDSDSGGDVGGSGVTVQDVNDARDKWAGIQAEVQDAAKSGGVTQDMVDRARQAAQGYSAILVKVEHSNAPSSTTKGAFTARTKASGPQDGNNIPWLTSQMAISDAQAVKAFETDPRNVSLADIAAAKTDSERAKLWAQRAVQLQYTATHVLTQSGKTAAGSLLIRAEQSVETLSQKALAESGKYNPKTQQSLDALYEAYQGDGGTIAKNRFIAMLKSSADPVTFAKAIKDKQPFDQGDYDAAKAAVTTATEAATWDDATQSFIGDLAQVQAAKDLSEAMRSLSTIPGNPSVERNGIIDPTQLSDGDWYKVANGDWTPDMQTYGPTSTINQGPWGPGGALDESSRSAKRREGTANAASATDAAPADTAGGQTLDMGGVTALPPSMDEGAKNEPQFGPRDQTNDEQTSILDAADAYLKSYEPQDLPAYSEPSQTAVDYASLFPSRPF